MCTLQDWGENSIRGSIECLINSSWLLMRAQRLTSHHHLQPLLLLINIVNFKNPPLHWSPFILKRSSLLEKNPELAPERTPPHPFCLLLRCLLRVC